MTNKLIFMQKTDDDPFDGSVNPGNVGHKTKSGIVYTIIANGGQFSIRFVGSIILARLLFPEDFGLMAIVSMVMQLANRLTNFGFSMVLVQRKDLQREHIDTVFFTNLLLMGLLTLLVFFASPIIADFFANQTLEPIIRIVSFNFLLLAITSVPRAILKRKMMFKEIEIANTIGKIMGVFSPVCFALAGFGVYSLVYGLLLESLFLSIIIVLYAHWCPKLRYHFWALKDVFSFGMWVYIAGYVNYGINKIDFFTVGKFLDITQLGFYERAFNMMSLPRQQIAQRIGAVMFSSYSRLQDKDTESVELLKKSLLYISLITYPLMIWMFFVAPSLISVLFGPKWIASIHPFQIMCIAGIMDTFSLVLDPTLMARGFIGNRVIRDFLYFIVLASLVLIGTHWGISGVAWGVTTASLIRLILKLTLVKQTLPFTLKHFFLSQKSAAIYGLWLAIGTFGVQFILLHFIDIHSFLMLTFLSISIICTFILTHLIIRKKDVANVLEQIYDNLFKIKNRFFKIR